MKNQKKTTWKALAFVLCWCMLVGITIPATAQKPVKAYASEEAVSGFVKRLYTLILDRTPDEAGLAEWTGWLMDGTFTGAEAAQGFIMSNEFLNKEMSNEEFVQILYSAFFDREADESGLTTWVDFLDQGYRKSYIFAGFANSTEFGILCDSYGVETGSVPVTISEQQPNLSDADYNIWLFAERMYTEVLDRPADINGIKEWVELLKAGTWTGAQVASGFVLSEEFQAKELTNEEYVELMYMAFFGRVPGESELEFWVDCLETDYTREYIFAGFANSTEFGTLCNNFGIIQGSVEVPEKDPEPTATPTPEPTEAPEQPENVVIGNEDYTTSWWTAFSDTVKVEAGTTKTVTFKNYGGIEKWNNFIMVLQNIPDEHLVTDTNGYKEYAVVRADNFGWGAGFDGYATLESNWNWDTFVSDMNGADVVLTITNNGTTADVVANIITADSKSFYQKYTGIVVDGDLYYCLTVDGSYIVMEEATEAPELEPVAVIGNEDCSTAFWSEFSDTVKVEAGTTKTVTFKNYGGAETWNNVIAVLQNIPDVHLATDTNGYKEYAVVRLDNWGWGAGFDGYATKESNWNWETFVSDMKDADVVLTITNDGTTADVVMNIITEDRKSFYQKYTGIAVDGDLYYCLTVDGSYITIMEEIEK